MRSGRGDEFLDELREHLTRVAVQPELYGEVARGKRAAPLPYSRFVVYYRVEPGRVVVLAVQHERADPSRWLKRR